MASLSIPVRYQNGLLLNSSVTIDSILRKILQRLSYERRYNRDDFTVEYLSTLVDTVPRVTTSDGRRVLDIGILAPDCFHFMKELHSRIGV